MNSVVRTPKSEASPRQIQFARSARPAQSEPTTGTKAAAYLAVSCVPVASCSVPVASSSVASRPVAFMRGSSPRSVLARALDTLQRAARRQVSSRIAERLATFVRVASVAFSPVPRSSAFVASASVSVASQSSLRQRQSVAFSSVASVASRSVASGASVASVELVASRVEVPASGRRVLQ